MSKIARMLKDALTQAGRFVEYSLTGETDYRVRTSAYRDFDIVSDTFKARLLEDGVRGYLQEAFGMALQAPVILELYHPETPPSAGETCPGRGVVGFYRPHSLNGQPAHLVYVQRDLPRGRYKAIFGHELVHAYERESGLLAKDRVLREGLARWVEYKILLREGAVDEARKVRRLTHWTWGRGVHVLLDIEKRVGTAHVVEFLRQQG